ncbi:MAG: hypothetical protein IPI67_12215 [Myxococcales bacterium]|nr:hypothetical protein [Myxococcales bacterium]
MRSFPLVWPGGRTRVFAWALGFVCLTGLGGCPAKSSRRSEGSGVDIECGTACAALTGSGCEREGAGPKDQAACVDACRSRTRELRAWGCGKDRTAYLACVAGSRLECSAKCAAATCLERREGIAGCAAEHALLEQCAAPCRNTGSVTLVDRDAGGANVLAELVRAGCTRCPPSDQRAPPGSDCQAASVCSQTCCTCADGRGRYLARVCRAGACAASDLACASAQSSGLAPCSAGR